MLVKILSGSILVLLFLFIFSYPSFAETNYYTVLSNFQRTGFYYTKGPIIPTLNFKLKIMENNSFNSSYGFVTDSEGNIYVPARYKLLKYSKEGIKLWEFNIEPLSSWAMYSPLVYGDRIYFTASYGTHHILCLDLEGNLIWQKNLKMDTASGLSFTLPPIVSNDILYVYSSMGSFSVMAFNKDTGDFLGLRNFINFPIPYLNAGGVLASNNLIFSTMTGEISGIDLKRIFREDLTYVFGMHTLYLYRNTFQQGSNTHILTLPVLDLDNNSRTYIVVNNAENTKEAKLLALNEVLQKDWEVKIEGKTRGNVAVDKAGNLYFELQNVPPKTGNVIYSYTKEGEFRWDYEYTGYDTFPNIILDSEGKLFVVGGNKVFAIESDNGIKLWEYTLDNYSQVTPILDKFGNLLVVDFRGNLYSFKGEGEYTDCKRRFYCSGNIPKHNPVVLVHG
ncbi:MAG: PQQ-binding-like beta-propeller repeat protein, partial [bacterium]